VSVSIAITNIARGSLHDGPGVRTVVYFKGCSLNCKWCHNPETQSAGKQVLYMPSKCIHCGKCIEICPEHHRISGCEMVFLRDGCTSCGRCTEICPSLALTMCGENKTVDEIFEEIQKDMHYYSVSGGGVTFSGGECLLYPEFVSEIAMKCKKNGIGTAVESAFFVPWENIQRVLPFIDLFFADLKIPHKEKHIEFTGRGNQLIIDNIKKLSMKHDNIILRIPVIPGVNDTEEDFNGFSEIINSFDSGVKSIELLRYNHLAEAKYSFMGKEYVKFSDSSQTNEEMTKLCAYFAGKTKVNCYFV